MQKDDIAAAGSQLAEMANQAAANIRETCATQDKLTAAVRVLGVAAQEMTRLNQRLAARLDQLCGSMEALNTTAKAITQGAEAINSELMTQDRALREAIDGAREAQEFSHRIIMAICQEPRLDFPDVTLLLPIPEPFVIADAPPLIIGEMVQAALEAGADQNELRFQLPNSTDPVMILALLERAQAKNRTFAATMERLVQQFPDQREKADEVLGSIARTDERLQQIRDAIERPQE